MVGFLLAAMLTVCQLDWNLSNQSEYVDFKEAKTYVVTTQDCQSTKKRKYIPPPPPPPPVAIKEEPKCTPTIVEKSKLGTVVYFDLGSYRVKKQELEKLDKLVETEDFEKAKVVGYTCDMGSSSFNKKLSDKRAKIVADYLEKLGIEDIEYYGSGECPEAAKAGKADKSKFRKAEVHIFNYEEICVFEQKSDALKVKTVNKNISNSDNIIDFDEDVQKLLEQHPELKSVIKGGKVK